MTAKPRRSTAIRGVILLLASSLFTAGVKAQVAYVLSPPNIVQNGSFELFTGTVPPPPWTGTFGMALGFSGAADGRNFADLSSTTYYAAQALATIPGQPYEVSFAVSGNSSFPGLSIVDLGWGGAAVGTTTWVSPYTPGNGLNFNWVYGTFDVVATSSSTLLSFQRDLSSTSAGTWLDAVQAVPVPEPPSLSLLSLGLLALSAHPRATA